MSTGVPIFDGMQRSINWPDSIGGALRNLATPMTLSVTSSYWLTRITFLRYFGLISAVAFLISLKQNQGLIGDKGITPAKEYLQRVVANSGSRWQAAKRAPTLLLLSPLDDSARLDPWLQFMAIAGLVLSSTIMIKGAANVPMVLAIWVLYMSISNVGQRWFGFGWESQLLETAFLAMWMVPLWSLRKFPLGSPPPLAVVWWFRWMITKIMLGAGLIKLRGDKSWKDLTAMCYHYETQPLPNPISPYLHRLPVRAHKFETLMNHVVELGAPWLIMLPLRRARLIGGAMQVLFQTALILSGNLSFLNHLTILPAIWCFDDASLAWLYPRATVQQAALAGALVRQQGVMGSGLQLGVRLAANCFLTALLARPAWGVVRNLMSDHQVMNSSSGPLRLHNTYGAFGAMSKVRKEIVVQAAREYNGDQTDWREYQWRAKPGDIYRKLRFVAPYHYRLDWSLWIASLSHVRRTPWFPKLLLKLLEQEPAVTALLADGGDPFADGGGAPKYIKADLYDYRYAQPGSADAQKGAVWERSLSGRYFTMSTKEALADAVASDW